MGVIEGNAPVSDNDWETITRGGDDAIRRWVAEQLEGKSCTVVLIGTNTAGRKWIKYEIEESWNDGKGVVGISIHNLQDRLRNQSAKGRNPFDDFTMKRDDVTKLSKIVKAYDPPYTTSTRVYDHIKENMEDWVDEAINIRTDY
jgi:hypothetical protein